MFLSSVVHLLLSAVCFAAVSRLRPVIVSAVTALSHPPRLSVSVSPSDSGAWIPPPAQRPELQPLAAAAGHRHPLRGHQTVSFTVPDS